MISASAVNRLVPSTLIAALSLLTLSAVSGAAEVPRAAGSGAAEVPRAINKSDMPKIVSAATAPNARLVALVAANGQLIQSKGVASVSRINTGVYCIRPDASTNIKVNSSVATVSVEWSYSRFNEVTAQWARSGVGCGSDRFGVVTLSDFNLDARYVRSNDTGFIFIVP